MWHSGRRLEHLCLVPMDVLLVGALAIVLIVRGMPSFLQENGNLSLLPNFVITPASSDSEPTVRLARESLAPAVVQSGPGQPEESSGSEAAPAVGADLTPTPTPEGSGTANDGAQAGSMPADTAVPPTEPPVETPTPIEEAPTATAAAVEYTVTPTPPFSPLPTLTGTATATATVTPTPTPTPIPTQAWMTYTIRAGDTIVGIANRFDIPQDELRRANNLTLHDDRNLQIGDVIVLPGRLQATPTPTPTEVSTEAPTATPAG